MRLARALGLLLLVVLPVAGAFALFSRVRFWFNPRKGDQLDAEWKEVGLRHARYKAAPSLTPTPAASARSKRELSYEQLLTRGVLDPAAELQAWEIGAVAAAALAGLLFWRLLCPPTRSASAKSHAD
jgi:hypothetical protein